MAAARDTMIEVAATILLATGALVSAANASIVIECARSRRFVSLIPLVGGLFGAAGVLLHPSIPWYFALAFLVCDLGTLSAIAALCQFGWLAARRTLASRAHAPGDQDR